MLLCFAHETLLELEGLIHALFNVLWESVIKFEDTCLQIMFKYCILES